MTGSVCAFGQRTLVSPDVFVTIRDTNTDQRSDQVVLEWKDGEHRFKLNAAANADQGCEWVAGSSVTLTENVNGEEQQIGKYVLDDTGHYIPGEGALLPVTQDEQGHDRILLANGGSVLLPSLLATWPEDQAKVSQVQVFVAGEPEMPWATADLRAVSANGTNLVQGLERHIDIDMYNQLNCTPPLAQQSQASVFGSRSQTVAPGVTIQALDADQGNQTKEVEFAFAEGEQRYKLTVYPGGIGVGTPTKVHLVNEAGEELIPTGNPVTDTYFLPTGGKLTFDARSPSGAVDVFYSDAWRMAANVKVEGRLHVSATRVDAKFNSFVDRTITVLEMGPISSQYAQSQRLHKPPLLAGTPSR